MALHPMLNTAIKAARRAAGSITRTARDLDKMSVEKKSQNDFVTEADKAAEESLIESLLGAYPEHSILTEEQGWVGDKNAEFTWIIDPIDGTTNFMHGHPQYAISIGLLHKGAIQQAVVYAPAVNDMFIASRGVGAFLNERRIRVSRRFNMNECLIGTGFPVVDQSKLDDYLASLKAVITKTAGVRREGAASLDLCNVAAGRTDGFWEMNLKQWDYAAGSLILQEAGGIVTDFSGNDGWWESGDIVAGNPRVLAQLLQMVGEKKAMMI